jgi:nitroreductase
VDRNIIEELIDMVRYAPSGHNMQTVKWLVIYDTEEVNRMSGLIVDWMRFLINEKSPLAELMHMDVIVADWERGKNRVSRGAPHLIVAHAPLNEGIVSPTGIIAPAYLELAAPAFGLGTCWFGYFMFAATAWEPLQKDLNLPEEHACAGVMMIGYPKYKYQRIPLRNKADVTWR